MEENNSSGSKTGSRIMGMLSSGFESVKKIVTGGSRTKSKDKPKQNPQNTRPARNRNPDIEETGDRNVSAAITRIIDEEGEEIRALTRGRRKKSENISNLRTAPNTDSARTKDRFAKPKQGADLRVIRLEKSSEYGQVQRLT